MTTTNRRAPYDFVLFGLLGWLCLTTPAMAAKWHSCPEPPLPVYPSIRGATAAPFVHPGHDMTIVLNANEAASAGFSLAPGGNRVAITFSSLAGAPVALADRVADAASSTVLTFEFPDTQNEVGRPLAGPVDIRVFADGQLAAHISSADFVALPPATDVTPLVLGADPDLVVTAALAADGDLWLPAYFVGDPMAMPGCEGNFIMPVSVQIAAAEVVGAPPSAPNPLEQIRKLSLFMGDLVVNGYNFYGMELFERIELMHVSGTTGISLCQLNDAENVVIRVHGNMGWLQAVSPVLNAARDSNPVPLRMIGTKPIPGNGGPAGSPQSDSFGSPCSTRPAGPN